jgi:hypothetical protein
VRCQRRDRDRHRLALAPQVGERQRQDRLDGVVELVGAGAQLFGEERDALLRLAEVPQRAGHLDHRAAPALAGQAAFERLLVQQHRQVRVPGRVERARPLEVPDGAVGRQLAGEPLDQGVEVRLVVPVDRRPSVGDPALPLRVRSGHGRSLA